MAIEDKPNQNLFGTNYNPEDEEEKKARLAAQGAMMGSGDQSFRGATGIQDIAGMQGVPQGGTLDPTQGARDLLIGRQFNRGEPIRISDMGSLIQAPAVAPFSMEAAGQVNPMMEQQNLESFAQPQVIFRDYDVPATPPASALSVFTPGGKVKPNVDVNAITPSPEMTSTSAVNTALNKEVAVGSPSVNNDPSFMSGLSSIFYPPGSGGGGGGGAGLPPTFTPPSSGATQAEGGTDITPVTLESLGLESSGQRIFKEGLAQGGSTQPPPGASALGATQFTSPDSLALPSETVGKVPSVNAFSAENAGQVNPMMRAQSQEQLQAMQNAPTNGLTTVGGASLSEFLSGQAMPEQGFTQAERPLGGRGVTLTPDQMNELSAEREARLDARLPGDQSVSDRDRRAARGDDISMADQTAMAKANARGATPSEVARGNQVANALGVDLKTGQPPQATGGLTFDQVMKMEEFDFKRGQEAYKREQDDLVAQGKVTEAFEKDSALLRQVSGDAGRIGRLTNEAIGITTEPGTTALSGSLLKNLPGSNANQLKSILEVISSKVALDRLMEVKKTGATLGQVSEKELAMLQNSYDALQQSLPPERLREALTNYANQLKKVEDQTQRAFIDKHGQDKFNKIMGGGSMGQGEPKYANDQNVGDSADTYYNPSK